MEYLTWLSSFWVAEYHIVLELEWLFFCEVYICIKSLQDILFVLLQLSKHEEERGNGNKMKRH